MRKGILLALALTTCAPDKDPDLAKEQVLLDKAALFLSDDMLADLQARLVRARAYESYKRDIDLLSAKADRLLAALETAPAQPNTASAGNRRHGGVDRYLLRSIMDEAAEHLADRFGDLWNEGRHLFCSSNMGYGLGVTAEVGAQAADLIADAVPARAGVDLPTLGRTIVYSLFHREFGHYSMGACAPWSTDDATFTGASAELTGYVEWIFGLTNSIRSYVGAKVGCSLGAELDILDIGRQAVAPGTPCGPGVALGAGMGYWVSRGPECLCTEDDKVRTCDPIEYVLECSGPSVEISLPEFGCPTESPDTYALVLTGSVSGSFGCGLPAALSIGEATQCVPEGTQDHRFFDEGEVGELLRPTAAAWEMAWHVIKYPPFALSLTAAAVGILYTLCQDATPESAACCADTNGNPGETGTKCPVDGVCCCAAESVCTPTGHDWVCAPSADQEKAS